jgi:hypothetical protein
MDEGLPTIEKLIPNIELLHSNVKFPIFAPPSTISLIISTFKPLLTIIMVPNWTLKYPNITFGYI